MTEETAVAKKKKGEVAVIDFAKYGNAGLENIDHAKEIRVPYLSLMQKGSAQVDKDHADHEAKTIVGDPRGAVETGDWIDSSRKCIVAKSGEYLETVCCNRLMCYDKWSPPGSGRRVLGRYIQLPSDAIHGKDSNGKDMIQDSQGNEFSETAYAFIMYKDGEEWYPAIMSLSGGRISSYRDWVSLMNNQPVKCSFAYIYNVESYNKVYANGKSGYVFRTHLKEAISDQELVDACFKVYEANSREAFLGTTHDENNNVASGLEVDITNAVTVD